MKMVVVSSPSSQIAGNMTILYSLYKMSLAGFLVAFAQKHGIANTGFSAIVRIYSLVFKMRMTPTSLNLRVMETSTNTQTKNL
jgi:hypothetical protein